MIQGRKNVFSCAANFLKGRKCVFCGSFQVSRTARGYVRCRNKNCGKQKSLKKIRTEIAIIQGFYQQQPAYRLCHDLGLDYQTITRMYQSLREAIYHITELEGKKLSGEIEMDEAYFGGRRKGMRGLELRAKALYSGFWSVMEGYIRGW
jgi:transposase